MYLFGRTRFASSPPTLVPADVSVVVVLVVVVELVFVVELVDVREDEDVCVLSDLRRFAERSAGGLNRGGGTNM